MAISPEWGDPTVVPQLIAQHILTTSNSYAQTQDLPAIAIDQEYLSNAISEITPETQTMGAALLQLTVIDPDWSIQRSGICDQNPDGMLYEVDINFPEGTDVWWRLAMVDGATADQDSSSPNLTLTFQHRIISYLMDCWGPLGWPHGKAGTTRAQFIKMLADRMPSELPKGSAGPGSVPNIQFVCPEINEVQPIASSNVFGTEVITDQQASAQSAGINKLPGLTAASKLTIKGQKLTQQQIMDLNTALGEAAGLKAGAIATEALIFAGIAETGFDRNSVNGNHTGVWQSTAFTADQVSQAANAFLTGGPSFQGGGAIKLARTSSNPIAIAETVEAGGSYAGETGYQQFLPEAKAIIAAFDGGVLTGGGVTATPESDVAQLTRGTPDNPDEDSWTCMQRLASEVNWLVFSSPSPAPGVWGNYLYYMDGPTCAAQRPSLYLELSADGTTWSATDPDTGKTVAADGVVTNLSYTFDNTAFLYEQTRKVKGKVQRHTRIRTPQTPSQVMFNMICGALEFNGGDVFVFHDAGPLKGRWIVEDVTHNTLADLFAQFTLGPPTFPYPEPQSNTVTVTGTNGQPVSIATGAASASSGTPSDISNGVAQGVADVAKKALARQKAGHMFHYSQTRPIQYDILTGNPVYIDCSGFAIACAKNASLPDPSNNNYDGAGYTGDMITNCTRVSIGDALPGDYVFYGPPPCLHVTVYIGNGQVISMGQEGDPSQGAWTAMGPCAPYGVFRSNFFQSKAVASSQAAQTPQQTAIQNQSTAKLNGIYKSLFT